MLIELIYSSDATHNDDHSHIESLLDVARRNNREHEITGVLFFDGEHFLQIIEGEEKAIRDLYAILESDSRHDNLQLLHAEIIERRSFEKWVMAYNPLPSHTLDDPRSTLETVSTSHISPAIQNPNNNYGFHLFGVLMGSKLQSAATA